MGKIKEVRSEIADVDSFPEFKSGHKKVGFVNVPWVQTRSCDIKLYVNLRYPANLEDHLEEAIQTANKLGLAAAGAVAMGGQLAIIAEAYSVAFKASLAVSAAELLSKVKYHINKDKVCGGWHS